MSAYAQFGYGYPASSLSSLPSSVSQLTSSLTPPATMPSFGGSVTVSPGASTTSSSSSGGAPCVLGSSSVNNTSRLSSPGSISSSGVPSQSVGALSGGAPGGPTASSPLTAPRTSCCETGRVIATDPHTGQSICSCQYTPSTAAALLSYPRMAAGIPHPTAGAAPESLYGSPYAVAAAAQAAQAAQAYGMPLGADTSAFYPPINYDIKDRTDPWSAIAQPTACYPYDPTLGYAYGQSALAQRKNATREATGTLKAWLQEHIKNPYPTKGEKIMLAIITKMTLTQVSTWFANARRRLKKENKMVWSPRNRSDEDGAKDSDDDMDDDIINDKDGSRHHDDDDEIHVIDSGLDDVDSLHGGKLDPHPPACAKQQQPIGSMNTGTMSSLGSHGNSEPGTPEKNDSNTAKPRIWSLADVATSGQNTIKEPAYPHTIQHRPVFDSLHVSGNPSAPGHKEPYGHIHAMSGFRPWVNGSMYPPSQMPLPSTHPSTLPGMIGSGSPPSVSLGMTHDSPSGGINPSSLGTSPTSAGLPASGLLRPYALSVRAEVH